jgi:hypothetical protein
VVHEGVPAAALAVLTAAVTVTVAVAVAGCAPRGDAADRRPPEATRAAGPPPGASQPAGPPLATASAAPSAPVEPTDPISVAADCFTRWQSYDATVDKGPTAGVERAGDCLTDDFAADLRGAGGAAGDPDAAARVWPQLVSAHARSTVEVLAAEPVGGVDTSATGRVALVLNVRRITEQDGARPATAVSTPALTMLRRPDGTWRLAGADLSYAAGDAPGR